MCDLLSWEGMKMHIKMTNVLQMYFCGINIRLIRTKLQKVIISTLEIIKNLHIFIIRDTGWIFF